MSRSKRKNPFHTRVPTSVGEMKAWKKMINRKIRRSRVDIFNGGYVKKMSEIIDSPSEGKSRFDESIYLRK